MISGIDHLVIAVRDLDRASADLRRKVGLVCTGGGRHEGLGTANRIAFLADGSYVELMTVEDEADAHLWPIGAATVRALRRAGKRAAAGGLAAYALHDDELPRTVERLRAAGSAIGPVTPGSRRRPDGELVRWWTAVAEPIGPSDLPFLIRHARIGAEWGPAGVAARSQIPHPAGGPVHLVRLDLAVTDPVSQAALHLRHLGLEYGVVGDVMVTSVGRHAIRLRPSHHGPTSVRLKVSGDPRTADALGVRWDLHR